MRKIAIALLVILLVASMSIPAFAATAGGFVSSPSNNEAPELVEGKNKDKDCTAEIVISAYGDRDKLSAEARQAIEAAYTSIKGAKTLDTLNSGLTDLAKDLKVELADLAVSDLFDIGATACDAHSEHGEFDITLKADTLKNFVCLMYYQNGSWQIVDKAKVTKDDTNLEFKTDVLGPYAVVVATGDQAPDDSGSVAGSILGWTVGIGAVLSAAGTAGYYGVRFIQEKKVIFK